MKNIDEIIINTFECFKQVGNYIYLGSFPQTIKDKDVEIIDKIKYNNQDYYIGTDNCLYVLKKANPFKQDYIFSNGDKVNLNSEYYFKVEPVKWEIIAINNCKALLFSEAILDSCIFDDDTSEYETSYIRSYLEEMTNNTFSNKQKVLLTNEKLFLLSKEEITNSEYGFNNNHKEYDITRRKQVTDYAIANYVWYDTINDYFKNGRYWLRTAYDPTNVYDVYSTGDVDDASDVGSKGDGIVPAIWFKLS